MQNKSKFYSAFEICVLYAQQIVISGFPVASLILIAFRFGPSLLGEFSQILAFSSLAQPLLVYSFDINYFQLALEKNQSDVKLLSISALAFRLTITVFSCIFLLIIAPQFHFIPQRATFPAIILSLELASAAFQQIWLHNALNTNKELTAVMVCARLTSTALYFSISFTETYEVLQKLAIAWAAPSLVASIILYFDTKVKLSLQFRAMPMALVKKELMREVREGSSLFAQNMQIFIIKGTSPLVLGFLGVNSSIIGLYAIAEKVIQSFVTLSRPYRIILSKQLTISLQNCPNDDIPHSRHTIQRYFRNIVLVGFACSLVSFVALRIFLCGFYHSCDNWLNLIFSLSLVFSIANGFWCGSPSKLFGSQGQFLIFSIAAALVYILFLMFLLLKIITPSIVYLATGYLLSELALFCLIFTYLKSDTNLNMRAS